MNLSDIQSVFSEGHKEVVALFFSGETKKLRLFMSTSGILAYKADGKKMRGYALSGIVNTIESISTKKLNKKSVYENYISNLRKFKKIYTTGLHSNLWSEIRDGYSRLDISEFEKFVDESETNKNDRHELYNALHKYAYENKLNLVSENHYKLTTIKSNAPLKGWNRNAGAFDDCLKNIKKHLDKKENFRYGWESNYDVSVSGKLCDDGIYRAWFSLEFRGCGNGHYYLLVNENQAVFDSDD